MAMRIPSYYYSKYKEILVLQDAYRNFSNHRDQSHFPAAHK